MRLFGVFLGVLFLSLLLSGCGGDERPTMREACLQTGEQWCYRAVECFPDGAPTAQACLTDFMGGCCQNAHRCDDLTREGFDTDACAAALVALSCDDIGQGAVPTACME